MTDDPILAAIAQLGADLRGEIVTSRRETSAHIESVHTAIGATNNKLERKAPS